MKSYLSSTIVLAMFVVLSSCEPPAPIIEPGSYLPAYPGSYWKYVSSNGVYTMQFIEPYVEDEDADGNKYRVPVYNGKKLWKYTYHLSNSISGGSGYFSPAFTTFMKDDVPVGSAWGTGYITPNPIYNYYVIAAKDTSITIGANVFYPTIVVEFWNHFPSGDTKDDAYYYTQNVGLIREESYSNDTTVSWYRNLYEYHIHHY